MQVTPIKTRIIEPPQDDIYAALQESITAIPERSILAITSKIVSIGEGRCILKNQIEKEALIQAEADSYLEKDPEAAHGIIHTIRHGIMIASAGIDASNSGEYYTLWPLDPDQSAKKIWEWARKTYSVEELGVVITDSRTTPMRRGVTGISIGSYGFIPLEDYRGTPDLFGETLKVTMKNIVDGLASAAVLVMGEGSEATPAALMTDVPGVTYIDEPYNPENQEDTLRIPQDEDLYKSFLATSHWKKGGGGHHI